LGIDLPEASGQKPAATKNAIDVSVSESGEFAVNGNPLVNADRATLKEALAAAAAGRKDMPFFLTADAKATHQNVVTVMDVAGELGFINLSIVTREPKR
jgi:biopolymer transport protein ExbD